MHILVSQRYIVIFHFDIHAVASVVQLYAVDICYVQLNLDLQKTLNLTNIGPNRKNIKVHYYFVFRTLHFFLGNEKNGVRERIVNTSEGYESRLLTGCAFNVTLVTRKYTPAVVDFEF